MKRVAVALSGGVDSSAAALILKQRGYEVGGIMMLPYEYRDGRECPDVRDAELVAAHLRIPFECCNLCDRFEDTVIRDFVDSYDRGLTPNPCVVCNKCVKFGTLLERAMTLGYDFLATGHYAEIEYNASNNRYLLKRAQDLNKDQSYMLYSLSQEQLSHIILPLSGLTKEEIRELAASNGLVTAKKGDSQDICFVPDGDYASFIERVLGKKYDKGSFVLRDGTTIGEHEGHIKYTIGQRKGLGISYSEPLYVCEKDIRNNRIVLGSNDDLFSKELDAENVNLIAVSEITDGMKVMAKARYRHVAQPAKVWQTSKDTIHVEFDEPQRAITEGQSVVLYDGDYVVGGGVIRRQEP